MIVKTVPLKSVRDALMCATLRTKGGASMDGKPMARFAAFSQYPDLNIACREARRGYKPYPYLPLHFGVMSQGDLARVLAHVRVACGLPEVRRIWGEGLRALKVEFDSAVVR